MLAFLQQDISGAVSGVVDTVAADAATMVLPKIAIFPLSFSIQSTDTSVTDLDRWSTSVDSSSSVSSRDILLTSMVIFLDLFTISILRDTISIT